MFTKEDYELIIAIDMLYLEDLANGAKIKTINNIKYIIYKDGTYSTLPSHLK